MSHRSPPAGSLCHHLRMTDAQYNVMMTVLWILLLGGWVPVVAWIKWRSENRPAMKRRLAGDAQVIHDARVKKARPRGPRFQDSATPPAKRGSQDRVTRW